MTRIEDCAPVYQNLKDHVDRLKALLDQPEPGLWAWCNCVALEVKAIGELYGERL